MAGEASLEWPKTLNFLFRPMTWVPQRSSRHHRKWLDLICRPYSPFNWADTRHRKAGSRWLWGGLHRESWGDGGVEEISLHQPITTKPFKDLDVHPGRKPGFWTRVTESTNDKSVLAQETPTLNHGSITDGQNYLKGCSTSLPSTGDILEELGSGDRVGAPSLPGGR